MNQSAVIVENIDVPPEQPAPNKIDYINLVKGFSRLFWGLALAAILLLSQTSLDFFSAFRLPAYFVGTVLQCWGLLTLCRAGKISPRWCWCVSAALALAALEIYFFPFAHWWKLMPYVVYFAVNVAMLALSVIALLFLCNMIVADLFGCLALKGERLEAQIYAFAVIIFMAIPFFIALFMALFSARRYQTAFYDELLQAVYSVPVWFYIVFFIPYSLTLAMLWKARDRSYQKFCREKEAAQVQV